MERNFKEHFRTLQNIYLGLFVGMFLFAFVIIFFLTPESTEGYKTYDLIFPFFSMITLTGSFILFKYLLENAMKEENFKIKFSYYKYAKIAIAGIWETTILIALIIYFFSGNMSFLFISSFFVVLLLANIPTIPRYIDDLELSEEEIQKLNDEHLKF